MLDPANKTLTIYADGVRVGQTKNIAVGIDQVLDQQNADRNKLYIGRSQSGGNGLKAKLHDVRLYSEALNDEQVATIRRNAIAGTQMATKSNDGKADDPSRVPAATTAKSSGPELFSVPDITATTTVGQLPKLPVMIAGVYTNGEKRTDVRVIWPSPRDNNDVAKAGTYTVTGKVAGTIFTPKATVTVSAEAATGPAPRRTLEAFNLGQVVLNQDANGHDSQFIKNRDKFVTKLAETNPDNFLYMFRDAFGQPQPEGARALGGWDNQTTRLRGHASGHYLSALAQGYASTVYDDALHTKFLEKMNYMIDTLYDLSQKSGNPKEEGGPSNADPTKVPPGPNRTEYDSNLTAQGIRTDYWNWGKGFISAYPPDQFIMLENGATYGGRNNQIWAPYYTLHKILAGLLDCYEVGGNEKALEIAKGMGLWVVERLNQVPTETRIRMWNRYIAGEYGGMNEVMARLYRITKDSRFLDRGKAVRQHRLFLWQREPLCRFGGECRHAARQACKPAYSANHRRLGNIPRQPGAGLLPNCRRTSGTWPRIRTCIASAAWRAGAGTPSASPPSPTRCGKTVSRRGAKRNLRHVQHAQAHPATVHVSAG